VCEFELFGLKKSDDSNFFWIALAFKACEFVSEEALLDFVGNSLETYASLDVCVKDESEQKGVSFKG
jgi:hypothetical protein